MVDAETDIAPPATAASQVSAQVDPVASESSEPTVGFWRVFFSTFVTIFLAELGDKTQVTTLLMSAESHAPWIVFLGASSALIATSLIGVLLGQWLANRLSPRTLDKAAGCLLLAITGWLLWDISGF
ncbi:MAG: TMEM165/GDT1 family protein [Cyanobacteria bacterium Co-bin8]|nr:TMEM165/GDT1 family protein [Cyanobacteria bacterium Co-bin8]